MTVWMTCWLNGSTTTTGTAHMAHTMANHLWSAILTWLLKHLSLMMFTRIITLLLNVYRIQITGWTWNSGD